MRRGKTTAFPWLENTRGETAIEYVMIIGGVALVLVVLVFSMGDSLETIFQEIPPYLEKAL